MLVGQGHPKYPKCTKHPEHIVVGHGLPTDSHKFHVTDDRLTDFDKVEDGMFLTSYTI